MSTLRAFHTIMRDPRADRHERVVGAATAVARLMVPLVLLVVAFAASQVAAGRFAYPWPLAEVVLVAMGLAAATAHLVTVRQIRSCGRRLVGIGELSALVRRLRVLVRVELVVLALLALGFLSA